MGSLEGKVAVITGANSGIGRAAAKRFASEGARVFMTGRRQAELDAAVAEVGHGARGIAGDVSNLADLDRLYAVVGEEAERIDVLLANAGGGELAPLGTSPKTIMIGRSGPTSKARCSRCRRPCRSCGTARR